MSRAILSFGAALLLGATLLLTVAVAIVGCGPRTADKDAMSLDPIVYRDTATGCEYLSTDAERVLTPRMRADGTQVCGGAK